MKTSKGKKSNFPIKIVFFSHQAISSLTVYLLACQKCIIDKSGGEGGGNNFSTKFTKIHGFQIIEKPRVRGSANREMSQNCKVIFEAVNESGG